jgi:hypothetical protein
MTSPPPDLTALARRVIRHECGDGRTSVAPPTAARGVFGSIVEDLSEMVGTRGAWALARRALAQARRDGSLAGETPADSDPSVQLGAFEEAVSRLEGAAAEVAATAAIAHLLEILVALLGAELGLRPVRKRWPTLVSMEETDSREAST